MTNQAKENCKEDTTGKALFEKYGGMAFIHMTDVQLPGNFGACLKEILEEGKSDTGTFFNALLIETIAASAVVHF